MRAEHNGQLNMAQMEKISIHRRSGGNKMSGKENEGSFAAYEQATLEVPNGNSGIEAEQKPKQNRGERGFAAMDASLQKEIARKGGAAVSKDREHMAEIGRKGGEAVSKDREHMSNIGRKGGKAGGESRSAS
jgi:general stress protein YciG